jgi:hypothetical protein
MIQLFLLNPNFIDPKQITREKLYYCPDCAIIEGVLSYYPELRKIRHRLCRLRNPKNGYCAINRRREPG